MTLPSPAVLLAAIAAIAALRAGANARRRGDAGWRIALLVLAPFALAAALWRVLEPAPVPAPPAALVVATAATPTAVALAPGERLVALPEAPAIAGAERVPDLGTALRRHPQATTLRVLGAGLPARDHDAARGRALAFVPAPLPAGIVALQAPTRIPAGRTFVVRGRVEGGAGQTLALLDPAGSERGSQPLDAAGDFAFAAVAGPAGRAAWTLRRRGADGADAETLALPLQVDAGAPLRVLVLAGAVNPETKYLRRWALDAGFASRGQASVGGGVDVGDADAVASAERLAQTDLLVLDLRRWRALGDGGRATLRAAVRDGLGLLLRIDADPDDQDRATLAAWGFALAPAEVARDVRLPAMRLPAAATAAAPAATAAAESLPDAALDAPPPLSRRAWAPTAADGAPLLRDADGRVLALWRAEGRGRVALWNLADTFRLVLAGRADVYGGLWAEAADVLARPTAGAATALPSPMFVDERTVLCGLGDGARLRGPDGAAIALAADAGGCAAFWPQAPGWHALDDGDRRRPGLVRAAADAPGLHRAALAEATAALAAQPANAAPAAGATGPGSRWPGFAAFLLLAAAAWWLERARAGRRPRA